MIHDWFWALCDKEGDVYADEFGRSAVFNNREAARQASSTLIGYHVEKVEIETYDPSNS